VVAAFLATALPFFFVALADFSFRPRIAFFCIELRFLAMVIPLAPSGNQGVALITLPGMIMQAI
jgi:hypothetical protein